MNWTWPGRAHVMIHREFLWLTFWFRGRRYHYATKSTTGPIGYGQV